MVVIEQCDSAEVPGAWKLWRNAMQESLSISPNRLFDVADAILSATQSKEGLDACISVWIENPPTQVNSLSTFTEAECVAAMALLIRMGYIDAKQSRQQARRKER